MNRLGDVSWIEWQHPLRWHSSASFVTGQMADRLPFFFFSQHQLASFISLAMVPEMFSVQKLCMGYVHAFPAWIMFVHIEQFLLEVYFCVKTCLSIQRQKCYAKNKGIQSGFKACLSYWAQNTHRRINETCPFPWTSAEREREYYV